jgi:cytochrome c oxidase subunit 3
MPQPPDRWRTRLHSEFQLWPSTYQVGILAALASVAAFFIALVTAYSYAISSQTFRGRIEVPPLLWLSTGILLVSSVVLERARAALLRARVALYSRMLRFTLILGSAFLLSQMLAAFRLYTGGVFVRGNPHGSMFYMFTGIHALHLLGGLAGIVYLLFGSRTIHEKSESGLRRHRSLAGVAAMYWHFMGFVWFCLFALLHRWA